MKRLKAIVLTFFLAFSSTSATAADMIEDGMVHISRPERVANRVGVQQGTEIVVGSTTPLAGVFGMGLLTGTSSDETVRDLLEGYSTIAMTRTHDIVFDGTAIQSVSAKQDPNGDRTYTIEIAQGLTYNDGSPITSKDYLFTILLFTSPELLAVNISPRRYDPISGIQAYQAGTTNVISGVRYVSDTVFSIRIDGQFLPSFYGMEMLKITPFPYRIIAPGCDIMDHGQGVFIGSSSASASIVVGNPQYTPGIFNASMLKETLTNRQTGYIYNPKITAGPYSLESFNLETGHATFVINERYQGNYEGQKPHIQRIIYKPVDGNAMLSMLMAGEIDIANKVVIEAQITEGLRLSDVERLVQRDVYPRDGLAYLSLACERGATSFVSVRKAISRAIDRERLIDMILGVGNAIPVYGFYGIGQWMLKKTFQAEPEKGLSQLVVRDAIDMLKFDYHIEDSKDILIEAGWTLNANRTLFVEGMDDIRYLDAPEPIPLVIHWAIPIESDVAPVLKDMLTEVFQELGIGLTVTEMPFVEMLQYYYREKERTYDMFFLSNNFDAVFDPYYDFQTADVRQSRENTTGFADEMLVNLAKAMRMTTPSDTRSYITNWIDFQFRFVEMMPIVPLYSNVYFDFYKFDLRDYDIKQHSSWASALCYAWLEDSSR